MKNNVIKVFFATVFVAVASYGSYNSLNNNVVSDLVLVNVEALAQSEASNIYRLHPCPSSYGNECKTSSDKQRESCVSLTYCR